MTMSAWRYSRPCAGGTERLLEEAHIKLSRLVSDLLGISARRVLHALADGETNPTRSSDRRNICGFPARAA